MPEPLPRTLAVEAYRQQVQRWPRRGRHILAQYDDTTVVVYQAYRSSIARWAAEHGRLGGPEFKMSRMSWIKPNFLWMMFRCGWASKVDQEAVLAIRILRSGFDAILAGAVPSSYASEVHDDPAAWKSAVARSNVRLQWDPDHLPGGTPAERRAIQLGLRGETLRRFVEEWTVGVEDISPFVTSQRKHSHSPYTDLVTPREEVYRVSNPAEVRHLGLDDV